MLRFGTRSRPSSSTFWTFASTHGLAKFNSGTNQGLNHIPSDSVLWVNTFFIINKLSYSFKSHNCLLLKKGVGEDNDDDESNELLIDDNDVEKGYSDQDEVDLVSRQRSPLDSRLGFLRFRLEYLAEKESLLVTIVDAIDIPAMDSNGKADPYVAVYLKPGTKRFTTSIKSKCRNPTFNESVDFPLKESEIMSEYHPC